VSISNQNTAATAQTDESQVCYWRQ